MTNIIKYLHGWKYTKGKEQQLNPKSPSFCPIGCGEHESQLHYLTCKEQSWVPKVKEESHKLKRRLIQMKTAPVIISIISQAMTHDYSTRNHKWPQASSKHEKVAYMAATEQQQIGWKNLLQGRLSKKWALTQHYHLKEVYKSKSIPPGTYELWKKSFIPTLIQYGLDLWELRNGVVHGSTPRETAIIRRNRLNKDIIAKYSKGPNSVSPAQRRLFQKPEVLRLYDSNHSKQNWLISVTIAQQARKEQLRKLYASYPRISTFDGFSITTISYPSPRYRSSTTPPRKTKSIQKTLRELFLNAQPSVRYKTGTTFPKPQNS